MLAKSASAMLLAAGLALQGSAAAPQQPAPVPTVEAPQPPDTPEALKGFRGLLIGTIISKKESSFVLKVEKVARTFKGNEAKNPEAAVGQQALISLSAAVRPAVEVEKMKKALAALPVGARVRVGAFCVRGDLIGVEEITEVPAEQ